MKTFLNFILVIGAVFLMNACNSNEPAATESTIDPDNTKGKVVLSQDQIKMAGFEFGKVEKKILSGDVNARGKLSLPKEGQAFISPVMRGVVNSIEVKLGDPVNKGQVLAYLTHPDYIKIQEEFISTKNNLEFLEDDFNRQKRLYEENVSSQKKFLQAKTNFLGAEAKLKSLDLMIRQSGLDPDKIGEGEIFSRMPVKSPITGIVNNILVTLGTNVSENDILFDITCRKKLHVELDVFEKDIIKIKKGQRVEFTLSNINNKEFEAYVLSTGGSVKQAGRVVKVIAEFYNEDQTLLPGMFVAAKIHTGEEEFDALPESAIMNFGTGNPFVYYTTSDTGAATLTFERVAVRTGYVEDGYVQVDLLNGIPQGSHIVTKGGYYVNAEENSGAE